MKNFKSAQLALAIALASGVLAGCNNSPERAGTDRDDQDMVSMKKDADIKNRSADKAAVLPRGDVTEDEDEYSLQEDYQLNDETTEQTSVSYNEQTNQQRNQQQSAQIDGNETVLFEFDSAELTSEAKESLDQLVSSIEDQKDDLESITIHGFADALGPDAYNEQLSQRRAQSVKTYLQNQGIDAESWNVEGKGEDNPVASNDSERGRSENRRVVVEFSDEQTQGYSSSFSPD